MKKYKCTLCDISTNDIEKHFKTQRHIKNHKKSMWCYFDIRCANYLIYKEKSYDLPLYPLCRSNSNKYEWNVITR
jgi:hypothetical protein